MRFPRTTIGHRVAAFVVPVLSLGIFAVPTLSAQAQIPFGGPVAYINHACVNGTHVILGPPRGGSFMWVPGTISYRYGPPVHPGQQLLGMAGPPMVCLVPCPTGLCPAGSGLTIIYHGSSI